MVWKIVGMKMKTQAKRTKYVNTATRGRKNELQTLPDEWAWWESPHRIKAILFMTKKEAIERRQSIRRSKTVARAHEVHPLIIYVIPFASFWMEPAAAPDVGRKFYPTTPFLWASEDVVSNSFLYYTFTLLCDFSIFPPGLSQKIYLDKKV